MKIYPLLLGVAVLLLSGCQTNSSPTTQNASTTEVTSPAPAASSKAQQRQADVLEKDTLNAVQEEVVRKASENSPQDFKAFFKEFEQIIQQQDAAAFNQLIDPQRGLFTIETTGAMPNFYLVQDISKHQLSNYQKPFFSIRERFKDCQLQEVKTLPKVDCEGDGDFYTQKGCFVSNGAEFRQARLHQYASLKEAQNQAIDTTLPLVSKAVLHTASGYKFYFGQLNGQWKVLFIDLMTPCSA